MDEFKDKVLIITGGSNGIGKKIVDDFTSFGAKVVVIDIKDNGINCDFFYKGDITKKEVLEEFYSKVIEKYKRVDYLVNNACESNGGIFNSGYEEFLFTQKLGCVAPFYLSKLFLNHFSSNSVIINISSTRAFQSQENTECYSAAKGAILSLTHSMAVSLRGKVRVNAISPGWINTYNEELTIEDKKQHLVDKVGESEDISNLVQFLCSNKANFITGENIVVDGGMSKQMIYHNDKGWQYER